MCQQDKAEHRKLASTLQILKILKGKWDHITMDFVVKLSRKQAGHDAIWAVVDRLTKTTHFTQKEYKHGEVGKVVHQGD